jgi:hypothetical protein
MPPFLAGQENKKADLLEQTSRILAGAFGLLLWFVASYVKVVDPLIFLVGSALVLFALNGIRFSSFSLGKDGVKMGYRSEEIVNKTNRNNTPRITTSESMPDKLCKEADNIIASINTDGMGAVKIVHPDPDIAVGIGKTLAATGIEDFNPEAIVGIGLYKFDPSSPSSVLVIGEDGRTFKIEYGSMKDNSTPDRNQEATG